MKTQNILLLTILLSTAVVGAPPSRSNLRIRSGRVISIEPSAYVEVMTGGKVVRYTRTPVDLYKGDSIRGKGQFEFIGLESQPLREAWTRVLSPEEIAAVKKRRGSTPTQIFGRRRDGDLVVSFPDGYTVQTPEGIVLCWHAQAVPESGMARLAIIGPAGEKEFTAPWSAGCVQASVATRASRFDSVEFSYRLFADDKELAGGTLSVLSSGGVEHLNSLLGGCVGQRIDCRFDAFAQFRLGGELFREAIALIEEFPFLRADIDIASHPLNRRLGDAKVSMKLH